MITISKEDFELALPVGVSAHDEVYENVRPAIDISQNKYCSTMLGDVGIKQVSDTSNSATLKQYFKMTVCIDAFLSVFRQLDLVLTPTGFGIVSNDTVSPASKQRVDALEGSLRTALCRNRAMAVFMLRSAEWGKSPEAKNFIRYIYSEHYFFFSPQATPARSYQDWGAKMCAVVDTDEQLRMRFGDAQIDDLIDAYRCNDHDRLTTYATALQLACDLTDKWDSMGKAATGTPVYRRLEREIEENAVTFAIYHESDAYKAAHAPVFENKKESSAFLFNG